MLNDFGSIEVDVAHTIIKECEEAVKNARGSKERAIKKVQKRYAEQERRYRTMPREEIPERYTRFSANYYPVHEGKFIIEFTFQHINSRCTMFWPDGWALQTVRRVLIIDPEEGSQVFS